MKKIVIFTMMTLLIVVAFDFGHVNADATSNGMGFTVDSVQYGTCKDTETVEGYTYVENMYGVLYAVGFSQIKTAVYEDQTDDDWASVIIRTTTNPIDVWIKGFLGIKTFFDSYTYTQNMHSDITDGFVDYGYGYYIELEQVIKWNNLHLWKHHQQQHTQLQ
ncbi:MAG: hypothetical protein KKG64_00660 [Firmicutes bacterium]|nr:hypothetical protein [Bacillota bacterium]